MDIRENVVFCCGVDGKIFEPTLGKYSIYFRCPNYEFRNRGAGKDVCMNRLSLKDQNILYEELEKLQKNNQFAVGSGGKKLHLSYEIAEINEFYTKVYVINTSKIKL